MSIFGIFLKRVRNEDEYDEELKYADEDEDPDMKIRTLHTCEKYK